MLKSVSTCDNKKQQQDVRTIEVKLYCLEITMKKINCQGKITGTLFLQQPPCYFELK